MHACVILAFKCNATLKRTGVYKNCERRWKAFESWSNCSLNVKYSTVLVFAYSIARYIQSSAHATVMDVVYRISFRRYILYSKSCKLNYKSIWKEKKDLEMCWNINRNTERWNCTIYVYCALLFSLCYILRLTSCMRKNNTVHKYSTVNDM